MALNAIITPTPYLPIYNDYMLAVGTTFSNPLPPNYRFVCDTYINNNYITRTKAFPNPSNTGIFRLDRICQDYISYDYHYRPSITQNFDGNCNSIANVRFELFEEYGSLSTGTTIFSATSATTTYLQFYNGALSYRGDYQQNIDPSTYNNNINRGPKTFLDYQYRNYLAIQQSFYGVGGQFMTNGPRTLKMDYNDTYWVNIINPNEFNIAEMVVETYDEDNTQSGSYVFPNIGFLTPSKTGSSMCNDLVSVGIGPLNINSVQYSYGSAPIIDTKVVYYKVYTRWNDGVSQPEPSSEEYTIILNHKKYYQKFRFAWLNTLGGFDRFSFEGRNTQTKEVINTTEFKTLYGDGSGTNYAYVRSEFSREIIYQNTQNSYLVNSQFISEQEAYWLNELYNSPVVYLEIPENMAEYYAVEDVSGLAKLKFREPHLIEDGDLLCLLDCDDPTNNQYTTCVVEDPYEMLLATSFFNSSNGIVFNIGKIPKTLPVIINDKQYTIKQAITPRNISIALNFSLSLDDPRQRGGKNNTIVPFTP